MDKHTTYNVGVLPDAFREALQADLTARYNADETDSVGDSVPQAGHGILVPEFWSALDDAVVVITRQMRRQGRYPEDVLVAIKSAVREAAVPLVPDHLVRDVVGSAAQSCISTYFEPEVKQSTPAATRPPVILPPDVQAPTQSSPRSAPIPTTR